MRILFIGDIVGKVGRKAVQTALPNLKTKKDIDLVVANAENVTHGRGAKISHLRELKSAGIDIFTSGDHIFHMSRDEPFSDPQIPVVRPANYPNNVPGEGFFVLETKLGKVAIVNLLGLVFLGEKLKADDRNAWIEGEISNPFEAAERVLKDLKEKNCSFIFVDFHAEVTSEKRALGFFLDGKVAAVFGTHTHVPTADLTILPKGTAYISDVGMTGAKNSVLGVEPVVVINRLGFGGKEPFDWVEEGPAEFRSVLLEISEKNGKIVSVGRIDLEV